MQRLLIVSNRLPINVSQADEGGWSFQLSSGGLVSALSGVQKSTKFVWIGWPGIDIDESERKSFSEILLRDYSSLPVYIDQDTSNLHYNGFSNGTIWPLFHYLPADVDINEEQWEGYKRANQIFADYIAEIAEDGDVIWVHDYHLMLLPEMLRLHTESAGKNVKIGFFLHIPFPTSEVYRVLPYRKEVLEGILSADLVGFHTYDYARHFLTSCTRILGSNTSPASVDFKNRTVKVGAYPVGVEPEKFEESLKNDNTCSILKNLEKKYDGLKVIVGVERLDYIKGLTQKLLAFEELLDDNPEFVGKVVLIQVAIPSRTDVIEYQKLQNQVFELIGRINGKYSSLTYSPVQFIYNSVSFPELVALYRIAEVCLVTSTRDGMNLVACEYIATQAGKNGVLILSEFAGCAQSLNGAILINPWDLNQIKHSVKTALTLSETQKINDHSHLLSYVKKFTSPHWGKTFVSDLSPAPHYSNIAVPPLFDQAVFPTNKLFIAEEQNVFEDYQQLFSTKIMTNNLFYIYSTQLRTQFNGKSTNTVGILAENGLWIKKPGNSPGDWQRTIDVSGGSISNFSDQILGILQYYAKRVDQSFIQVSEEMIKWAVSVSKDRSFPDWIASELQMNLEKFIGHLPLKVQRVEHELRITHASTDLHKLGATVIQNVAQSNGCDEIIFISKNGYELKKIAEVLMKDNIIRISTLDL